MATYIELFDLATDTVLRDRTKVAITIAAQGLIDGTPTESDSKWSAAVFSNPKGEGLKALRYILAVNAGLTVAQIQSASDSALQGQVDAAVSSLVIAFNAV